MGVACPSLATWRHPAPLGELYRLGTGDDNPRLRWPTRGGMNRWIAKPVSSVWIAIVRAKTMKIRLSVESKQSDPLEQWS
jgi:hypothetical protein